MLTNPALLNTEVQEFIRNFDGDISKLAFGKSPFVQVSVPELMQQIEGRRRAEKKLPTWFATNNILFPPKVNLEQTSSEITAKYKASLIQGGTIADSTGGFGVDSYFFAENFDVVHHFETNTHLSELARHNFGVFNKKNVRCFPNDGLQAVSENNYDAVYADPSRRHDSKGKVFYLGDCVPNIPKNVSGILEHCRTFLLKTSPMLDISVGLNELPHVLEIHIVAVYNEVKELLWLLKKSHVGIPKIKTVNFAKNNIENFNFDWNATATATFGMPDKFLYEPNAALMKGGAFALISEQLRLNKLHSNTHLYTGKTKIDFPGRRFRIEKVIPYTRGEMREALRFKKANIATRNFPETVAAIRKKWKIAEGGDVYLFFITNMKDKKEMIVCSRI